MKELHHFYHVYCNSEYSESIVLEHLNALIKYNLYNNLKTFNIGLIGSEDNREKIKKIISQFNFNVNYCNESETGWEQETLDSLYNFSQNNDGYVLYTHTKGSSNFEDLEMRTRWRKTIEYYSVVRWEDCIKLLDSEYHSTGCYYFLHPDGTNSIHYYAGNFWWTDLKYIRKFSNCNRLTRYDAELWINSLKESVNFYNQTYRQYDWVPVNPIDETGRITDF